MDAIRESLNTTAMVIGYPVLVVIVFMIGWFGTRIFRDIAKIFREMRYDRWKRTREDKYRTNEQSSFMFELDEDYELLVNQYHHPTLELPDISEQLANYQEERYERP